MKKGTAIKEDNKARQFASVQKVVINKTSSGTSLWVPEDIAETDELSVTENGVYCAYDDNVFGYSQVVVNVSESLNDRSEKDKAISKITGTNPDTGDTESYGVDEDGNLTKEVIPSGLPTAIHIVIAPTKKTYNEGDSLDFTGIHVYLLDGEGHQWTSDEYPTGEIPFEELIFPVTTASGGGGSTYTSDWSGLSDLKGTYYEYYDNPLTMCGGYSTVWSIDKPEQEIDIYPQNANQRVFVIKKYTNDDPNGTFNAGIFVVSTTTPIINRNGVDITRTVLGSFLIDGVTYYVYWIMIDGSPTDQYYRELTPQIGQVIPYSTPLNLRVAGQNDFEDIARILFKGVIHEGGGADIPVQWMRSDGETLEDTFQITISSGGSSSGGSSSGGEHSGGDF